MSELERKAAIADILIEQMTTITALRTEVARLRSELEALDALCTHTPPDDAI